MSSHLTRLWSLRPAWVCGALVGACSAALGAEGSGSTFYPGDLGQAIAAILIFLLLLAVLGRWAWKPLVTQLRRREQSIADAVEQSEQRERESRDLLAHYTERIESAQHEAQEVIAAARREAAGIREEITAAAREEGQKFIAAAKQEVQQAKQEALRELYESAAELCTEVAAQVLSKSLDENEHHRLLEESISQIRQQLNNPE